MTALWEFDMTAWDDPRIARGMEKQLGQRRARIAAGEKPLGWKVGLGAKPVMERLGIKMPLVGYMMQKSLAPNGATVSVAGWTQPVAEPEIAVHMGADLPGSADRAATIAAIGALGPAIELADLNPPPADVEVTLAGNIFHRHVILGAADRARAGAKLDGLAGLVFRRGAQVARQEDLQANIGNIVAIVAHVAGTLAAHGETLRAGDVIITGSIVPPPLIEADETEFAYMLEPMEKLMVHFSR
jgi:2-keto-4-pentenoate hydratase